MVDLRQSYTTESSLGQASPASSSSNKCMQLRPEETRHSYRICQVDGDTDILQDLLLDRVGALELQDSVVGEDMLDSHNVVLRLLLSQLYRLTALEQAPIAGKLRHLMPHRSEHCRLANYGML